jgi:hypothetical protein
MIRTLLAVFGLLVAFCLAALTAAALAQDAAPREQATVKVQLRYSIIAQRDQHVAFYKQMIDHLEKTGFVFEPIHPRFPHTDFADPGKNMLSGSIARTRALELLRDPSVSSLLIMPPDFTLPEDLAAPIRVRLELSGGLPAARQLVLANQVRALLSLLSFKENVGYDDRGYSGWPHTRLVGTIPAEHLQSLVKDLRTQPTGWLAPTIETNTLPSPVRDVIPILVTEVIPDPQPSQPAARADKRGQAYLDKIAPDLYAMLIGKEDSKIVRAEIVLSYVPAPGDEKYRAAINAAAPSFVQESRLGGVVTGLLRVNQANMLASLEEVSVVRLARLPLLQDAPVPIAGADNAKALALSGLASYHVKGHRGQGVRIGIIDSDFGGYEELVKSGKLPRSTRLVDITTELNPDLYPDPTVTTKTIGHGTHCALAAILAAPEAELTLIRIDPASLHQLSLVAHLTKGLSDYDESLGRRVDELRMAAQALAQRRQELARERRPILDDFEDDYELKRQYQILGPIVRGWLFTPREWAYRRLDELEIDQRHHSQLEGRLQRFLKQLRELKGLQIVCTSLAWADGWPLGGGSGPSQWFDGNESPKTLWFVSAANAQGQTWTGPYRDTDGNGVMEFAAAQTPVLPGRWSRELNFLAWQPYQGERADALPEGARIRISVQWREPHDAAYFWERGTADRYLQPLADLHLAVLLQRDPSGKTQPIDDLDLLAHTTTPAFRIENNPSSSTYEQIVEFTVPATGRLALRVERPLASRWELEANPATGRPVLVERFGLAATGIRPAGTPSLPALEPNWELQPRIFVSVIDPGAAARGRPVFRDYSTGQGSIPILADTRSLIAVGAADFTGHPQPYTSTGSPGILWNFVKPNILVYDQLALTGTDVGPARGASLATPFAAGMAASWLSSGAQPQAISTRLLPLHSTLWRLP